MNKTKLLLVVCLLLGTVFLAAAVVSANHEQKGLSVKLIRLHVIANSDSQEDQALKRHVRDAILARLQEESWNNREAAEAWISENLEELCAIGSDTLKQCGVNQTVCAELDLEHYPTREYETFSLPSGEYLSLRVILGSGEGANWWCVVYPSICLNTASDLESAAVSAGFSRDEVRFITEDSFKIKIKFKLLDLYYRFRRFLQDT